MKPTMDLTGLPIDDAVALVQQKIDRRFAFEIKLLERRLIADGVRLQDREAMLEDERLQSAHRRGDYLDELRQWLAECNSKFH